MLKSIAMLSVLCAGVAATPTVWAEARLKNDQYLVSRSKDTYLFVDKGVVFSGAADEQQPRPTTGGPVYLITQTPAGLSANRLIVLAQCSVPYGVTLASQEVLSKTGKPVTLTEFTTKYDSSPLWRVSPSSHFGKVWTVLCENTWPQRQHWGEMHGGDLIERVSRRLGETRFVQAENHHLSFDITNQKTDKMSHTLPEYKENP